MEHFIGIGTVSKKKIWLSENSVTVEKKSGDGCLCCDSFCHLQVSVKVNLPSISIQRVTFKARYTSRWKSSNFPLTLMYTRGILEGLVSLGWTGIPVMKLKIQNKKCKLNNADNIGIFWLIYERLNSLNKNILIYF